MPEPVSEIQALRETVQTSPDPLVDTCVFHLSFSLMCVISSSAEGNIRLQRLPVFGYLHFFPVLLSLYSFFFHFFIFSL